MIKTDYLACAAAYTGLDYSIPTDTSPPLNPHYHLCSLHSHDVSLPLVLPLASPHVQHFQYLHSYDKYYGGAKYTDLLQGNVQL